MNLDEFDEVPPYEEWGWQELRAEAKARGLPATGTKRDLSELLWKDDEERDPEAEAEAAPEPEPEPLREPEKPAQVKWFSPVVDEPATPPPVRESRRGVFRREYPVPAEGFNDDFHRECLVRINREALSEGLLSLSGLYGANRVGWGFANGVKTAVYEDYVE